LKETPVGAGRGKRTSCLKKPTRVKGEFVVQGPSRKKPESKNKGRNGRNSETSRKSLRNVAQAGRGNVCPRGLLEVRFTKARREADSLAV